MSIGCRFQIRHDHGCLKIVLTRLSGVSSAGSVGSGTFAAGLSMKREESSLICVLYRKNTSHHLLVSFEDVSNFLESKPPDLNSSLGEFCQF
jgi:hypothetical protein